MLPVVGSSVAASKSSTPSKSAELRMKALSTRRLASCPGPLSPMSTPLMPSAEVNVPAYTLTPLACSARDNVLIPRNDGICRSAGPDVVDAFEPKHMGQSRQAQHIPIEPVDSSWTGG